ncbi:hypothetical protein [Sinomonas sp. B1-1]|uniref:hypothetical protein n=1 Tax=Sinomonas sp. B1-1 TaxID=3141454 RepID=UPI003D27F4A0
MSGPFIFISTYSVREGRFEDALAACRAVVELVQSREPNMLVFQFFADEAGQQITSVQVHSDSASMENHMGVISGHLAQSADWLYSTTDSAALGDAPASLRQWYQATGQPLARFPRHLAGVVRPAAEEVARTTT